MKYTVVIHQKVTIIGEVVVEADDEVEANDIAISMVFDGSKKIKWQKEKIYNGFDIDSVVEAEKKE